MPQHATSTSFKPGHTNAPRPSTCLKCGIEYEAKSSNPKYCPSCRDLAYAEGRRNWRWKTVYGVTPEDYERMWNEQEGLCKICRVREPRHIDHTEVGGEIIVRGLLCINCNTSLGHFGDDAEGIERVLAYVRGEL